ncbi:MAG TPA: caspase family protein [Myxococcaceae bacterium]|nr:caspase family protein [Myxococcaceae bacterium]
MLACALLLHGTAQAADRFAIVIGSNQGSVGRPKLWFAEQDADHFAKTLIELGEVTQENVTLLRASSVTEVREAFDRTEAKVARSREAGKRAVLVVYFSGHADPVGLELRDEQLPYAELRSLVMRSIAEVKVAIVDACDAGAFTQVKGVRATPSVSFPLPGEEAVEGVAFVASTAAGEAAQESAALGGSFFSHHLEVALRGAGDFDGDGRVTLAEAFRYASQRTVSGTFGTVAGPQHPTYALRMSGRGDVVLSDLRRAEARLNLPSDPRAQYILRGPDGLAAEVPGAPTPFTLGLPAGDYTVERRSAGQRQVAQVQLAKGTTQDLPALGPFDYEVASRKGGPRSFELFAGPALSGPIFGGPDHLDVPSARFGWAPGARIGAAYRLEDWRFRFHLEYIQSFVDLPGEPHIGFRSFSSVAAGLFTVVRSPVVLEVGPELGYTRCLGEFRQFDHCYRPQDSTAGIGAALSFPMGPFKVGVELDAALFHFYPAAVYPGVNIAIVGSYAF